MKSQKKIGMESEKRAAKKVNGETVRGSGCLWYNKGDYETKRFVFQNKFTSKNFYKITTLDLKKAEQDALSKNKDFIFSMQIQDEFLYCFPRILITEDEEKLLNLLHKTFNKGVSLISSDKLLLNDKYVVVHEFDYNKIKSLKE